jgi:peptidoglycan/LPS O-acetylase OafA/YrhL
MKSGDSTANGESRVVLRRLVGLDTIRFICALWVFMSHAGLLSPPMPVARDSVFGIAQRVYSAAFSNGPAAVIVFFLISGLCIHYPNAGRRDFQVAAFYSQRFLRILPPMLAAILVGGLVGAKGFHVSRETWQLPSFLWSLVAELVYYALYPGLRRLALVWGWKRLLLVSYAGAAAVVFVHPTVKGMPDYGYHVTWLVGLPCWLLGCVLGERMVDEREKVEVSTNSVWWPRVGIFALNVASWQTLFSAKPYLPAYSFIIALHVVGVGAYYWLKAEIHRFRTAQPYPFLEWAGNWSYSFYLVHELGCAVWDQFVPAPTSSPGLAIWIIWRPLAVLALCYGFFRVVEAPTHRFAQSVGRTLRSRPAVPVSTTPPSSA